MATTFTTRELDQLCVNSIRFLAVDAVQKAKSGHPGLPMGAATMAYVLWDRYLKHNPSDPAWPDRDRFVLSAGHGSMLLYALLHLTGYDLSIDDIKQFRQFGSHTAGHPELGTPGVEMTTGPLGQGFAHGVGMAVAERFLAEHYNRPGHDIVDHHIYAIVSDGDLMEGVSSEAASYAGTAGLGKLIYLYDDNGISIEGDTDVTFQEDVGARFRAYGWQVLGPIDGNDAEVIERAIEEGQRDTEHPTLIICTTTIGYGSPNKANTGSAHGEPLGEDEVALTRQSLGWEYGPFEVPGEAVHHMRKAIDRGKQAQADWERRMAAYTDAHPAEAAQLQADLSGELPTDCWTGLDTLFANDEKPLATRDASNRVMNLIAQRVHAFAGGSADLAPSNKTLLGKRTETDPAPAVDHNMHLGVREHAMAAIAGGMSLHGGVIPYTGTFLVFADYMRPALRLAAIMGRRVVYVFTHDSIGVGEDGPTHQPIEHLLSLRAMPNMTVIRPADATETAQAWRAALGRTDGPTALVYTRQALPILGGDGMAPADGLLKGAYVLWESNASPELVLIGTGSETHIALAAGKQLAERGRNVRVVSMPSWELFDAQPKAYCDSVLPPSVKKRISVEAGVTMGWERYVGSEGVSVGVDHYGASGPYQVLYKDFGLTAERVVDEAEALLQRGE